MDTPVFITDDEWSPAEIEVFNAVIAQLDTTSQYWLEHISARLPYKTPHQILNRFCSLLGDDQLINPGSVPDLNYPAPLDADAAAENIEAAPPAPAPVVVIDLEEEESSVNGDDEEFVNNVLNEDEREFPAAPKNDGPAPVASGESSTVPYFPPAELDDEMDFDLLDKLLAEVTPDDFDNAYLAGLGGNATDEGSGSSGTPPPPPPPAEVVEVVDDVAEEAPAWEEERRVAKGKRLTLEWEAAPTPVKGSKRGQPWSSDEHKMFLFGIEVHGRGAWKRISNSFVQTRTPCQVASHAQKYFRRQYRAKFKKPKGGRISVLDINTVPKPPRKGSIYDIVGNGVPWDAVNNIANNGNREATAAMPLQPPPPPRGSAPLPGALSTRGWARPRLAPAPAPAPAPYVFNMAHLQEAWQKDLFVKDQNGKS